MRLVFVSDTHGMHAFDVPNGDVLVHCGDFSMNGSIDQIERFDQWLASLPHKHKIVIAGNHELSFEHMPQIAHPLIMSAIYLQDSAVDIDGIKFYGSPWQPEFYDWAFNLPRGHALAKKWALIPDDTDILLTHGPAYGTLDFDPSGDHVGCEDLRDRMAGLKQVRIHAFGHLHCSYGVEQRDGLLSINAAICDETYQPTHEPVVVDFEKGRRPLLVF